MPTTYPPAPPAVDGANITVSTYLNNPARVTRLLRDLTLERFVTDAILSPGPRAEGGAVIYDQMLDNDLYADRDVQEIAPGADFPILDDSEPTPNVAAVAKYGGRFFVTDEARDRNRLDVFTTKTRRLRNTIIRKVDSITMAAIRASLDALDGRRDYAAGDWADPGVDLIADLVMGRAVVNDDDLGYELNTALISPATEALLLRRKDVRDALSEASREAWVRDAMMGRLLRLNFIVSPQIDDDEVLLLAGRQIGHVSDEQPLRVVNYREEANERTWIQGGRRMVPYITDPLGIVRLNLGAAA